LSSGQDNAAALREVFDRLLTCYGPQHWWPGETPFEVIVGAILTQNTNWNNAARAITALKAADKLSAAAIRATETAQLAALIRPSGYFNAKTRKLQAIAEFIGEAGDDLNIRFRGDTLTVRQALLGVHGVGPETADSILLYAAGRPVFVIDAYTARVISRLGLTGENPGYDHLQRLFTDNLAPDAQLFNEFHALIVRLGKEVCHPTPDCPACCLNAVCRRARS
jgi:endonuclease III related protein